jgi:hypothetical protein
MVAAKNTQGKDRKPNCVLESDRLSSQPVLARFVVTNHNGVKNMKRFLIGAAFATLASSAVAADVSVSVSIGQPGFYGRIDLGNAPQPQLIYTQPVIIQSVPVGVVRQPLYLRVPPGHEKNWGKHCRKYNACGQPVYFVQENWYNNVYAPRYRDEHGDHDDDNGDKGKKGKGHDKEKKNKKERDD